MISGFAGWAVGAGHLSVIGSYGFLTVALLLVGPATTAGTGASAPTDSARGADPGKVARARQSATLCHMDVSVRELRNHTGRVVSAIEAGEPVVLTVHGRPVADIVPRVEASERRPSELLVADLRGIAARAAELGVMSDAADYDVGWTTDDLLA